MLIRSVVYFMTSLMYALQFAAWKKADEWRKVLRRTCICITTARTVDGENVQIHAAADLMRQYDVPIKKDGCGSSAVTMAK